MTNINRGVNVSAPKDEWYTPEYILDTVRAFYGTIDLDPASNAIANSTVKATQYYDQQSNGLTQTWTGNVWLNPPYSRVLIDAFINKAISERPNYCQLILLINSNTETKYSQKMLASCDAVCFTNHRIRFIDPNRVKADSPVKGNAIYYLGDDVPGFRKHFNPLGTILTP